MKHSLFTVLFDFSNLELELDKFGFDEEEKMNVYTALAIVLHLGNITFQVGYPSLYSSLFPVSLWLPLCLFISFYDWKGKVISLYSSLFP